MNKGVKRKKRTIRIANGARKRKVITESCKSEIRPSDPQGTEQKERYER